MSRSILFAASLSALALAGCGHTTYRETVVERQPIVAPTVVERPAVPTATLVPSAPPSTVVAPSAIVAVPGTNAACTLGTAAYSHGTLSCLSGVQYQCVDGVWQPLNGVAC